MPKVSVIVPNYNHAAFLRERIESILEQTFQDFELILLDDCSTDGSRSVLDKYSKNNHVTHCVYNSNNSGTPFSQWAKGIALSTGEWIWIAESDDVADRFFLETLMNAVDRFPTSGLAYSHLNWINADGEFLYSQEDTDEVHFYKGDDFAKLKLLFSTTIFNVSSCVFRKDIYGKVNHELYMHMKMCGDYCLYTQLSQITDIVEVGRVLDSYRIHENNTSALLSKRGAHWKEQMPILDFICSHYSIPQNKYAHFYARSIIKNHYSFGDAVGILRCFLPKHFLVVLYWIVLSFKDFFKRATKVLKRGN